MPQELSDSRVKYYSEEDLSVLERKVNEALKNGFVPMGPPVAANGLWMQPLYYRPMPCGQEKRKPGAA